MKITRQQLRKLIQEVFIGSGPVTGQEDDEDKVYDPPYDPKPVFKSGKEKLKKSLSDIGYEEQATDLFDSDNPENVAQGIALGSVYGDDRLSKQERDFLGGYPQNIESLKDDPLDKYAWKKMKWDDYLYSTSIYEKITIAIRRAVKHAFRYLKSLEAFHFYDNKRFSKAKIKNMNSPIVNTIYNLTDKYFLRGKFANQYYNLQDIANYLEKTRGIDAFGVLEGLKDSLIDEEIARAAGISPDYPTPQSMKSKYSIVKSNKRK